MISEFLTAIFTKRWNGKYFNVWNFYLDILQIHENWVGRNFITNWRVYELIITQAKCRLKSTTTNGWRRFGQSQQRKSSVLFPIQSGKKSRFWLFCMWSVKEMYHALLPKADYRDTGRRHDRRLDTYDRMISQVTTHCCVFVLKP